jgi:ferric-dicitrate binding protein FerR (iron transport regulator)
MMAKPWGGLSMARVLHLGAVAGALSLAAPAFAQSGSASSCDPAPARAVSVQGTIETRRGADGAWRPVQLNDSLCAGDVVRAQSRSRADLMLLDQSVLRLNANATLTIEPPKDRRTGVVDLVRGSAHFLSRGPNSLEVKTPFTVAGVRGTEFLVTVEGQETQLTVFEGTVVAQNAAGSLTLTDGQSAVAQSGQAPVRRTVLRPRDAVHWALFYPPVVYARAGITTPAPDVPAATIGDARQLVLRAQRSLDVGAVDEARVDLERALAIDAGNVEATSLASIMTLVQGDKQRAHAMATEAAARGPQSAVAQIALSYAEQARFNLPGARSALERAVALEPDNALAWARLAEVRSGFGDYDGTTQAAERALALQPDLATTHTVLGFARLIRAETDAARASFERAIGLAQADPLPRLGLGLAKIRGGALDAGSRDLEIAASLDPGNALVRSYLGKAYYEEKRPNAERELATAKQLDPADPTPWFYDAFQKESTNRLVESLQALDRARVLNDNRAVYRSRLLLDSDAAARAASQARIYGKLGFQQRALAEGWGAVNLDPTNFSAHRFLADSYAALPRHEIARVSELLQSQLLAPVTNSPLQPRSSESNLLLLNSLGPQAGSFQEFNPLFNRDGLSLMLNGMLGSRSSRFGEAVLSGITGNTGFSLGYSAFQTDGYRQNNEQREVIGNVFVQHDFSPATSAQFEYRSRDSEQGDLAQRFFPSSVQRGLHTGINSDLYRVGLRHSTSPRSTFLGSVMLQDRNTNETDALPTSPVLFTDRRGPERAVSTELQHLWRGDRLSITSGVGYFDIGGRINQTTVINLPVPAFPCFPRVPNPALPACPPFGVVTNRSTSSTDTQHLNFYSYWNYALARSLLATVGASADLINGNSLTTNDKDQINPKFGLMWRPTDSTTVRAAALRTLKRTLITDQTLEPTQVAGFNQFYDDVNGASAWRYGLGLDQRFGRTVFAGAETSWREIDSPFTVGTTVREERIEETTNRAYAYWTPTTWLSLTSSYAWEKWTRANGLAGRPTELHTQRLPLGAYVFLPGGPGGNLVATYVKQRGVFLEGPGADSFWTLDAAVQYRLPRRYGFVSVGVKNLTDRQFNYYDLDTRNPQLVPTRMAFIQATVILQ